MTFPKDLLARIGVVTFLCLAESAVAAAPSAEAKAVHDHVLVLDSHVDVLLPSTARSYYLPDGSSRASLERLVEGSVDALVLCVAVAEGPNTQAADADARREADEKLESIRNFVAQSGGRVAFAKTADDVEHLHAAGTIAVILGFLNARSLQGDLANFDHFYAAGVRVAGLTHSGNNAFADSSRPGYGDKPERHHGLSSLGRDAVRRLNDLGVLIDVSQLSTQALLQTLALSRAPVVATHSDARGLVDVARNLSDAELDAIKANGGVVQLTPFTGYILKRVPAVVSAVQSLREKYGMPKASKSDYDGVSGLSADNRERFFGELEAIWATASLSDYVDQIDYVARRIGVDHVGVGSDFNHGAGIVGFNDESEAPNVTAELLRRGYSQAQIAAIWGGNFLRVLRAAQANARIKGR